MYRIRTITLLAFSLVVQSFKSEKVVVTGTVVIYSSSYYMQNLLLELKTDTIVTAKQGIYSGDSFLFIADRSSSYDLFYQGQSVIET